MQRVTVFPYKIGSSSARNLTDSLSSQQGITAFRVRDTSPLKPRANRLIINWGNSSFPDWRVTGNLLNNFEDVRMAGNKLLTFMILQEAGIPTPEWTTDRDEVFRWFVDGHTVFARETLRGHSGEGINILSPEEGIVPLAPLYVKYKKKKAEYRVHVFNGEVIDVQQKRRERGVERDDITSMVRSHRNGWVFCRDGIEEPEGLRHLAIQAVSALSLDFGAVDIIYNQHENQCYVLEVNTAPGLEGQTLTNYTNAIVNYINTHL